MLSKMIHRTLGACCLTIFCNTLAAQGLPEPMGKALKLQEIPASHVGLYVRQIGAAEPLVTHGEDKAMNPASLMKLLTTYAALDLLGPAYTWKTEAWVRGTWKGDRLDGDLILKGSGDPKITLEALWGWVRLLRQRGLREISGDLVLDRSTFSGSDTDPAQFDNEPWRAYNVGPSALMVNFKTLRVRLLPDLDGQTLRVAADPAPAELQLDTTRLKLLSGECGDWKGRISPLFTRDGNNLKLSLIGGYPASCGERTWFLAAFSHQALVNAAFRQLWEESGGIMSGGWREGIVPAGARLLSTLESPALADVVRDINKFSNNVMARQVFLTLAAPPATTEGAAERIREWLKGRGMQFSELVVENGSGLSRVERISPKHLGELLIDAFQSPVMPELLASLPLVAVDGTMQKRLRNHGVAGRAHIKTGTLDGVRGIAGYVLDGQGRRWVVVAIVNHPRSGLSQPALDALLQWVHDRR